MKIRRNIRMLSIGFIIFMLCVPVSNIVATSTSNNDWSISSFTASTSTAMVGQRIYFSVEIDEGGNNENNNVVSSTSDSDLIRLGTPDSGSSQQYKYYYRFDFGDNIRTMGYTDDTYIQANHAYSAAGTYNVKIYIKNQETGESKEKSLSILITEGQNAKPIAKINAPYSGNVDEPVSFDASNSYDPDGKIVSYHWDFGDGTALDGIAVKHAYGVDGTFTVTLVVVDNDGLKDKDIRTISITPKSETGNSGEIDQSQEDTNGGYVKIYGDKYYAQSFVPKMGKLDGVEICIEKESKSMNDGSPSDNEENDGGIVISSDEDGSSHVGILSEMFLNRLNTLGRKGYFRNILASFISKIINSIHNIKMGNKQRNSGNNGETGNSDGVYDKMTNLMIYVKDDLDGKTLATKFLKPEDVAKSKNWLYFDLSSFNILFDIHTFGVKKYYIVLTQSGGDEKNCYKWYYGSGDCYSAGDGYSKEGSEWKNFGNDFAFRTYGDYTGDEPDGTVSKYAVVVGTRADPNGKEIYTDESARAMSDVLSKNGWSVNLLIDISAADARNALLNMREEEDKDDMVLFYFGGHGGYVDYDNDGIPDEYAIGFMGGSLLTSNLNDIFDGFASDKIVIIIESCSSGGFISNDKINLKQEGRIIITSSKASEATWASPSLRSGVFNHFFVEGLKGSADRDKDVGNQDGIVTAEESFNYAQPRTTAWVKKNDKVAQTPQIYDGILGDVPLTTC